MTPLPETNAASRELGRLALRLGLHKGGAPEWAALARVCGVSPAALFAVMAQGGRVHEETLFPLLDGILAVTFQLRPRYNTLPLLMALGAITRDEVKALWDEWRAGLIRAEFGDDSRSSD
jgi:hypothetical protein